ncbi:MAG TPA: HAMP domain-containing histidine kinase [Nitrospirae bacterium]|nr:HAMP domain-containing histidine kinase [Nitrospirota bacterium]
MSEKKAINHYIWLIWLGVSLALAGVALIAINLNRTIQEEGERAFLSNLQSISESSSKSVELFMERVISEIVFQTQLDAIQNYDTPKVHAIFSSVLRRHNERISHMMLLDGNGVGKAAVVIKGPDPFQIRPQIQEFFKETMKNFRVNISKRMFKWKDYLGIAIGMPISRKLERDEKSGEGPSAIYASGMVMALLSAGDLVTNLIKTVHIEKSGFAWLYTQGGEILADPVNLSFFLNSLYGSANGGTARLGKEFGAVEDGEKVKGWHFLDEGKRNLKVNMGLENWFLSKSRIKILDQQWVMVVASPQSEATHLLNIGFRQSVMLVAFVVVIFLTGGLMLSGVNRRLARAEEKALLAAELEEKNRSLNELNRRMDEFVAVVSHDIRSPLNVIRGFIKVIQSSPEGAKLERETKNMMRSCNRLSQLTNDILDISKLEAGKMSLAYDPIVIDDIIMESMSIMEFATREKGLWTVINLGEETQMEGDSSKLLQVINNLIGNAVKFTPDGGTIKISKEASNGSIIIKVSDTGPGIDDEDKGLVFSKFEQARRIHQGVEPGSGLGLSICKSIVELHGGSIGVISSPGKGSTFEITLPVKRAG